MKARPADLLGFHGIAIRSREPERLARHLRGLLGLRILRRVRGEIVLGNGPELFVRIRRVDGPRGEGVEEIHVAVEKISVTRRRARQDALGGDSWTRPLQDGLSLTVREFRRPPGKSWRKRRPPA